ncbi:MAG: hypothetical protein ACFB16_22325 [Phormidesmis sp.]
MSISELNHFMTYVLDGWMLFSAGFISISFVSFVSKRIQEDIEAETLALAQATESAVATAEVATDSVSVTEAPPTREVKTAKGKAKTDKVEKAEKKETEAKKTEPEEIKTEEAEAEDAEAARLEEVAAVSEQLAKTRGKQTDTSSVSVST